MRKKSVSFASLLFLTAFSAFSLDFSLRPGGFVFFPAGPGNEAADGHERFDTGGGGGLGFELDLASVWPNALGLGYALGFEGGLLALPYRSPASGNAQAYSVGGVLGLSGFPLSRLFVRVDGSVGAYLGLVNEGKGRAALYWRGGGELGFRFTPMFTLAALGGWQQYQSEGGVFCSGAYAGLALRLVFEAGSRRRGEGAAATFVQDEELYPAFLSLYQHSPLGTITIRNNENAEIRDLRVSFRAGDYTASEFPCGTLHLIPKGGSAELPLYADFSPELLRFTDRGRVLGEVVIRYRFLGKEKQSALTVSALAQNRNVYPLGDPWSLAAFVSPTSPEILAYAKHITGLARSRRRTGLNWNMQAAVWLFEGLRAAGIRLDDTHAVEGEAQFPAETLGFRSGNPTDLGLLFAAALEASDISAALVPLAGMQGSGEQGPGEQGSGDMVVAFHLGIGRAEAELLFNGLDRMLVLDGDVWMPLSMSFFNDGFMAAWDGGARALNELFAAGGEAGFIALENAWETYPPAPLPAQGGAFRGGGDPGDSADAVMRQYIAREIQPLALAVQRQITSGGGSSVAGGPSLTSLHNRLGILLVRSGRIAEGKAAYERAAGLGSVPAMVNRGNLALIEGDYGAAERWLRQALAREPGNTGALRGLEKIGERDEY
jgi:hypothetical protein